MRILSRICSVLYWALFVFTVFVHGIIILALWMPPSFSSQFPLDPVENTVNDRALPFVVVGIAVFVVGFFLFRFMEKGRWFWFGITLAAALVLAGVGLYLRQMYPETITSYGTTAGYDSFFKVFWRHLLPLVVVLLQLLAGVFLRRAEDKELREEALREIKERGVTPRFE